MWEGDYHVVENTGLSRLRMGTTETGDREGGRRWKSRYVRGGGRRGETLEVLGLSTYGEISTRTLLEKGEDDLGIAGVATDERQKVKAGGAGPIRKWGVNAASDCVGKNKGRGCFNRWEGGEVTILGNAQLGKQEGGGLLSTKRTTHFVRIVGAN